MPTRKHHVSLTDEERQHLSSYVNSGVHSARSIKRARILLKSAEGLSQTLIAREVGVCQSTVYHIRRRYATEGLEAALQEKPRSGAPRTFSGHDEANLATLACTDPPEGFQRWSIRLLTDRFIQLSSVESISSTTVHEWLKKTNSSPG
jgi:transposase